MAKRRPNRVVLTVSVHTEERITQKRLAEIVRSAVEKEWASAGLTGEPSAETGMASWYGPGFHGRPTASGAIFNQHAVTCAHKTRKFGTVVRVTDLKTGRSIRCVIVDRGPYIRGRIIDLSRGAAIKLGIIKRGVARVRVEALR